MPSLFALALRCIATLMLALPLLAGLGFSASAQTASTPAAAADVPPVLFVHGNGDHPALWITTLWRMESNGVPRIVARAWPASENRIAVAELTY